MHRPSARQPLRLAGLAALCGTLLACAGAPSAPSMAPQNGFVYGPYKHLNTAVDPMMPAATTRVTGSPTVLASSAGAALLPGATALTLAFASGECGQEHWGGLPGPAVAQANVTALDRAGIAYIVSTGGEGNVFTCASDAGMEQFIQRYESPHLLGLDFDIESGQTPQMLQALVQRIKTAALRRPRLRISFTLPTFAASDTSHASLNPLGQQVLAAIRTAQLPDYRMNLMVMDFGPAEPAHCVVRQGRCDMAASAAQAARNLHMQYGVPLAQIEVTAMVGVNDVVDNVFTVADARALARFVRRERLGGLHFWSLDRDTPCADGATAVSSTCSSLNTLAPLAFSRAFAEGLQ
jgi:hypothetical protein